MNRVLMSTQMRLVQEGLLAQTTLVRFIIGVISHVLL